MTNQGREDSLCVDYLRMDERLRVREGIVMWAIEHSIETAAFPEAIWRLWSDVGRWPEWNADLERAELLGSFAVGSVVTMFFRISRIQ